MPFRGGISHQALARLQIGDAVIQRVKQQLVPHGAGNQKWDLSRTSGHAGRLTGLVHSAYGSDWARPMRNAGATMKYGAGNCQEQAAVAYLLLRELVDGATDVSFCVAWATKHSFAAIGIPNTDADTEVVIVDPWPRFAQAVLWRDHFCRNDSKLQVLRTKKGGKTGKIDKAAAKYQHINYDKELLFLTDYPANPTWNHEWCSSCKETIRYSHDLIDFSWIPEFTL